MEHTLGETHGRMKVAPFVSLNPCFNGTYSRRHHGHCEIMGIAKSLNPCFNGTYSRSCVSCHEGFPQDCLNPCFNGTYSRSTAEKTREDIVAVLILVLMEHTLGGLMSRRCRDCTYGLNPCFNGTYSRSTKKMKTGFLKAS